MFKTAWIAAVIVAAGASTVAACGFKAQETAQTPVPAAAQAPTQTLVPAADLTDQQKEVAAADLKSTAQPKAN